MAFAAIDTETTGVDAYGGDVLLQVAAYVTDDRYNILDDEGVEFVFQFSEEEVAYMRGSALPVVRDMHDATGLWGRLSGSEAVPYSEGDDKLSQYLSSFNTESLYMLGNSITLDRNFMAQFLPKSFALLHYRSLDVTSVRLFMEENFGAERAAYRNTGSAVAHEARADILSSLEQLKFYKSLLK